MHYGVLVLYIIHGGIHLRLIDDNNTLGPGTCLFHSMPTIVLYHFPPHKHLLMHSFEIDQMACTIVWPLIRHFFIKIFTISTHAISISIGVGSPSNSCCSSCGRRLCNSSIDDQLLLLLCSYDILAPVNSSNTERRDAAAVNVHPYPWDIHDA